MNVVYAHYTSSNRTDCAIKAISQIGLIVLVLILTACVGLTAQSNTQPPSIPHFEDFAFVANRGQWNPRVLYMLDRGAMRVWFANDAVRYDLAGADGSGHVVQRSFVGSDPRPAIAENPLLARRNFLCGMTDWTVDVPGYSQIEYQDIYPGISARYYRSDGELKYDLIVAPGADPTQIRFVYQGAYLTVIEADGQLAVRTSVGVLRERAPRCYLELGDHQQEVPARFIQDSRGIGFELGSYDRSKTLVIDPVLVYSSYLGGSLGDEGRGVAVDGVGNIYVAGSTRSENFPTSNGAYNRTLDPRNHSTDVFIVKLDPSGSKLIYGTYIGGLGEDNASAIRVMSDGRAVVAGTTASTAPNNFPVTPTGFITVPPGSLDGFVFKLNAAGNGLIYSTYLGGDRDDYIEDLAIDTLGNAFIVGGTRSTNFPTTSGAFAATKGIGEDAFITRLDATGSALMYSTFLGGDADERAMAVVRGPGGFAFVGGWTGSDNFPTTPGAYSTLRRGDRDCFVTQLGLQGNSLVYSTLIGGTGNDQVSSIAVDSARSIYITGVTISSDYPNVLTTSLPAPGSWFVSKFNAAGTLDYSRYIGVSDQGRGTTIQAGRSGDAYLCGTTNSNLFEITPDAFTGSRRGGFDVAFVKVASDGSIIHSSVIGGELDDAPWHASVLGKGGDLLVTGITNSGSFPLSRDAFDRVLNDSGNANRTDGFIMRFQFAKAPSISGPFQIRFDTLRCNSMQLDTFYVYNTGDSDLVIKSYSFLRTDPFFRVESPRFPAEFPQSIKPHDSLRFITSFTSLASNDTGNTLRIDNTDPILGKDPFTIRVLGTRLQPAIRSLVTEMKIGGVLACRGVPHDTTLTIANNGVGTVTVKQAGFITNTVFTLVAPPSFPRQLSDQGLTSQMVLNIRFRPTASGIFRDTLLVRIVECDTVLRVPVEGRGDSAILAIVESTLGFDSLAACLNSAEQQFTIVNRGNVPLKIDSITIAGAGFAVVQPLPSILAPNGVAFVKVRFVPGQTDPPYNAVLNVHASPCNLVASLTLHGNRADFAQLEALNSPLDFGVLVGCKGQVLQRDSTLIIVNTGGVPASIDTVKLPEGYYLIDELQFPVNVKSGDTVRLKIRYAPTMRDVSGGVVQVELPFQFGTCLDTLFFDVRGRRDEPLLEVSTDTINVDTLRNCYSFHDTTVTLFNRSGSSILIDSVYATEGVELLRPTLSFDVPPGGSVVLHLRFHPRQEGSARDELTIFSQPCGDSIPIYLQGFKEGSVPGFDQQSIKFPTMLDCNLPTSIDLFAVVRNAGLEAFNIKSIKVIGDAVFSVDQSIEGQTVNGNDVLKIPVRFSPTGLGSYHAMIQLVTVECNDTLWLSLDGTVVAPQLSIVGGFFGDVSVGNTKTITMMLTNSGSVRLRVDSIAELVKPFSFVSSNPPLPVNLEPGDSILVDLQFAPMNPGGYEQTPVVAISQPCQLMVTMPVLIARGLAVSVDPVVFCINGMYNGLVGDTVTIPVRTQLPRLVSTTDVVWSLSWPYHRLQFLNVVSVDVVDVVSNGITTGTLQLRGRNVTELKPQQLLMRFRVLAGPIEDVVVRLDSARFDDVTNTVVVCSDVAIIHVSDRCVFSGVTLGKYNNLLEPARPNPASSTIEVTYQQLEDARAILRVWDINGREVLRPFEQDLAGGRYTVRFSVAELAAGTYFYSIEAGAYCESRILIVER